jgi:hypothetical protein
MRSPRLAQKPNKSVRLVVSITEEQRERYFAAAARDVRVLSDWVRLELDRACDSAGVQVPRKAVG